MKNIYLSSKNHFEDLEEGFIKYFKCLINISGCSKTFENRQAFHVSPVKKK